MAHPEPFVDLQTVADFLGKDRDWLYSNQARLGIPRVRLGRHFRYRISEVVAWMEGNRVV